MLLKRSEDRRPWTLGARGPPPARQAVSPDCYGGNQPTHTWHPPRLASAPQEGKMILNSFIKLEMGKNNTTCGESTTVRSFVLPDLCLAQQSNRPGGPPGGVGAGPGLPLPQRLGPNHLRGPGPWLLGVREEAPSARWSLGHRRGQWGPRNLETCLLLFPQGKGMAYGWCTSVGQSCPKDAPGDTHRPGGSTEVL